MTDYWLSKLFFDLQDKTAAAEYRSERSKVLDRYPLLPEIRAAVLANDIAVLAPRVNAYLLRYYFQVVGMPDAEFIGRVRALKPAAQASATKRANG